MDFDHRFGAKIARCELAIAYTFNDKTLCAQALNAAADTAAIYRDGQAVRRLPKNDRLALYGDVVAEPVLCRRWFMEGRTTGTIAASTDPPSFTSNETSSGLGPHSQGGSLQWLSR